MGFTVWLGLWITPPDRFQGNLARLLYIHPAIATVALYWVGLVAAGGSLLYLWPRTRSFFWDRLAASAVEVGAVFAVLTLVTGSLWGRPVWGVWWTWDARLTSTALLLLLEIGYLALRRVPAELAIRGSGVRGRAAHRRRHPDRALLGGLVEHAPPGRHLHRPGLPDPRVALHVVDVPARLRRLLADLRLAPRCAVPGGGPAGRGGRPGAQGLAVRALERGHRAGGRSGSGPGRAACRELCRRRVRHRSGNPVRLRHHPGRAPTALGACLRMSGRHRPSRKSAPAYGERS